MAVSPDIHMQKRNRFVRKIIGGAVYAPLPITKGMLYVLRTCLVHVATHTYLPHITPCRKTCHLRRNMYFYMYFDMLGCDIYGFGDTLWFSMTAGLTYRYSYR